MKPRIKSRRLNMGLTTKEVAEELNVSMSTFYKLEEGYAKPSSKLIVKIANFYKCSIDEIYKDLNLLMEGE